MPLSSWLGFLDGLGGTVNGSFYRAPLWVDQEKKPGVTSFSRSGSWSLQAVLKSYLSTAFFFYSPNLVWFLVAIVQWLLFPFDLSGKASWNEIIWNRTMINVIIAFLYYGYWHTTIETFCSRPFSWKKRPLWDAKVLHNIFYTMLGAVQWAFTECAYIYGYTSGRFAQKEDGNRTNWTGIILWSLFIPILRDFHFYFAHRFLHIRFVYKYVHAVHHRNTDTEPFSGLCMHPAEHLYYFTCHGPLLWAAQCGLFIHPFLVTWMGVHVTLSPAASHSGYEDHWSADLYHYLHHRYFECNYGATPLIDRWMETYRDRLEPGANDKLSTDSKASLVGVPEHKTYYLLGVMLPSMVLLYSLRNGTGGWDYRLVSLFIASMPVLAAALLHVQSYRRTTTSLWKHYMAPFHDDTLPSLVVHSTIGGLVCCIWPAYSLFAMVLQEQE